MGFLQNESGALAFARSGQACQFDKTNPFSLESEESEWLMGEVRRGEPEGSGNWKNERISGAASFRDGTFASWCVMV